MKFPDPLIPGLLRQRYKRFLADVELANGRTVTAHCPNPGAMLGLDSPGTGVWLSPAAGPSRKLRHTLELVRAGAALVGVNTIRANRIAEEAIRAGRIPELAGYRGIRREVRYGGDSRIDLLLEAPGRPKCFVEVKSVTLRRDMESAPGVAEFPDAVTARGAKHLEALRGASAEGSRAVMLFLVQREDCARFRIAADIDPGYAAAFATARGFGVDMLCYACKVTPEAIELAEAVAMDNPRPG